MEGYIGGIALSTNVTLGKCIPIMICVVESGCIYNKNNNKKGTVDNIPCDNIIATLGTK